MNRFGKSQLQSLEETSSTRSPFVTEISSFDHCPFCAAVHKNWPAEPKDHNYGQRGAKEVTEWRRTTFRWPTQKVQQLKTEGDAR